MNAQLKEVELEQQALTWPQKARAIIVRDQESYNQAAGMLLNIADLKKEIISHHKPIKDTAYAAHKAAVAAEKRLLDPLVEGETIIKRGMGIFVQEQERLRLEAERKEREEAQRREEEARLALAAQAEQMGAEEETIEEILNTPQPMQVAPIKPTFQNVSGISSSRKPKYAWRVIDERIVSREFLKLDEVKINSYVRNWSPNLSRPIPGIEVYEDIPNIAVRGRRV